MVNTSGSSQGARTRLHTASRVVSALLLAWVAGIVHAQGIFTEAGADGPAQTVHAPPGGRGPIVIVISGQSGPASYQSYAAELARLGYHTVLLDGKDVLNPALTGSEALKAAIERAQRAPSAVSGKAAVIGFSLGGGGALYNAASMPEVVSMVVAYYPFTKSWADKPGVLAKRLQVPVLVLAAQRDRYQNCCLVETAQALAASAKETGVKFELVIYPDADHGFNLPSGPRGEPMPGYRRSDDRDAWSRTIEMLRQHQPLAP